MSDQDTSLVSVPGLQVIPPNQLAPALSERAPGKALRIIYCAIYVRVSTDEQAKEEHYSLPAQEEYCMGEIKKRQSEGWIHKITITDDGYGGAVFERPGLLQLLRLVKEGKINVVVVYRRDRLFRSMEIAATVQAIFQKAGTRILSHSEGMLDSNPQAIWMGQMIDANSQLERATIRLRILDAWRHAAKKGDWLGGVPSFGYSYVPGSKTLSVNEPEAKIVRYIFAQAAAGVTPESIAQELRRLNVYGRPRKKRKQRV